MGIVLGLIGIVLGAYAAFIKKATIVHEHGQNELAETNAREIKKINQTAVFIKRQGSKTHLAVNNKIIIEDAGK